LALGGILFCVGGAAIDSSFAASYNLAQFLGWEWGRYRGPERAPRFTASWLLFRDASGRRIGRVFELRAHWEGDRVVVDEVLLGRGALLKRLRGPNVEARGIPWENVTEIGERIAVRL
jgi:sporulation protein YlmC with PRC-barrel domain